LDPQTTSSILALIEDLKNRLGLTVVLITHEMKVITEICDRVAVMESGRVVEVGPVLEVFTDPKHPMTKSFVDAVHSSYERFLESDFHPKGKLVRILFMGEITIEPLVYNLIKRFDVEPNILQANLDVIKKNQTTGTMLLDLVGEPTAVTNSLAYLSSLNISYKELN
jgi:D-methionine transport system ATP-binding protein